jgi:hypothetical protein
MSPDFAPATMRHKSPFWRNSLARASKKWTKANRIQNLAEMRGFFILEYTAKNDKIKIIQLVGFFINTISLLSHLKLYF